MDKLIILGYDNWKTYEGGTATVIDNCCCGDEITEGYEYIIIDEIIYCMDCYEKNKKQIFIDAIMQHEICFVDLEKFMIEQNYMERKVANDD